MPTPDDAMLSPPAEHDSIVAGHPTCPPEELRIHSSEDVTRHTQSNAQDNSAAAGQQPSSTLGSSEMGQHIHPAPTASRTGASATDADSPPRDIPSPVSAHDEASEEQRNAHAGPTPLSGARSAPGSSSHTAVYTSPFPDHRFLPNSSSSLLRPGSKFVGCQTSDRQQYDVEVEIKHVDMRESYLCGYLRIKGLTEDHPSLTTYFEGEIIGSKYSFITQHPEWGSNDQVDTQHWGRFAAYKPVAKYSSRPESLPKDWRHKEHLFMRWKEYFLVPDHRVRTINGASFEGFYYICFNQLSGVIEGIYFHAKSEKFQKLRLEHVEDHGCLGAIEFC
ncbi:hypothetical protein M011DRAFT_504846 [Sporormia fimetaria CBS 119925]|uniref:Uncharacterized protein n=1 Tax=Sporormia fimetaria CBS 119925 TaxID=1340428 RepID=A0A6A6V4Z8_9PLEO|nr:hypothetical protein M011DRAFT_504846 [Sporormia fimetaria CBS 119925]